MIGMKRKILIVEDDTRIAMMLFIRLKAAHYETLVARNAVQAMSLAKKDCPHLIVLDISMPGGNGFLVAEWLRGLTETADVPIIFMTASRKPGLREEAREYGAAAFLEKPFAANKLLAAIQEVLGSPVGWAVGWHWRGFSGLSRDLALLSETGFQQVQRRLGERPHIVFALHLPRL